MPKKASTTTSTKNMAPGADPHAPQRRASGRMLGNVLGALCLMVFIIFDELWIGNLAGAIVLFALFVIQVFFEKSKSFFASPYLYASLIFAALAYAEYRFQFLSNMMGV